VSGRAGDIAKSVESVALRPNATFNDIAVLCEEAARLHLAAVAVLPVHVATAVAALASSDVKVVALISFPFGADGPETKRRAVAEAAADGADDVEVVMSIARFLSGDVNGTRDELAVIVRDLEMRHATNRGVGLRAVVETAYLDDGRVRLAARVLAAAGVAMAVTSTGLAPRPTSALDVSLLREELGTAIAIKAAGGIRTLAEARELIAAGAARIGTSAAVDVLGDRGRKSAA
jgi:deoxyribose-phosphate aldolase